MKYAPTDEERAAMRAQHAHRHPRTLVKKVIGDGGAEVALTFVIGNPSGACQMPEGMPATSTWSDFFAATIKGNRSGIVGAAERLAADCVIWPDGPTRAEWYSRWPALAGEVGDAAMDAAGADATSLTSAPPDLELPPSIAAALKATPRACPRLLKTRSGQLVVLIMPPPAPTWRILQEELKKPDTNAWRLVRDLSADLVLMCATLADDQPVRIATLFDELPGTVGLIYFAINKLAGAASEYELGEL